MNHSFNSQPPEGGWDYTREERASMGVSTHSRPKAAGGIFRAYFSNFCVSTHSRPKAAEPLATSTKAA